MSSQGQEELTAVGAEIWGDKIREIGQDQIKEGLWRQTKEFRFGSGGNWAPL